MPKHMQVKPLLEWFDNLPEPIRTQALNNHYEFWFRSSNKHLNVKETSLRNALIISFPFITSPEGSDYWNFISNSERIFR